MNSTYTEKRHSCLCNNLRSSCNHLKVYRKETPIKCMNMEHFLADFSHLLSEMKKSIKVTQFVSHQARVNWKFAKSLNTNISLIRYRTNLLWYLYQWWYRSNFDASLQRFIYGSVNFILLNRRNTRCILDRERFSGSFK